jgi:uncharacterized protein YndB with AHSA1/START domain
MPGFEERAVCRAPAEQVWKLLYDPARFADWWDGWERVEPGEDGAVTRYDRRWPDFAYPASVSTRREDGRVVVSCQLSDIVHEWTLEPAPGGCAVAVRVELPEGEEGRLEDQRVDVRSSLGRLVALAEAG